jgi:hypothetical protein
MGWLVISSTGAGDRHALSFAPVLDHAACGWSHHAGYHAVSISTTVNSTHAKPSASMMLMPINPAHLQHTRATKLAAMWRASSSVQHGRRPRCRCRESAGARGREPVGDAGGQRRLAPLPLFFGSYIDMFPCLDVTISQPDEVGGISPRSSIAGHQVGNGHAGIRRSASSPTSVMVSSGACLRRVSRRSTPGPRPE